jgi:antitoxin component YwqK of YwqJK toxin-antitoxin module
MRQLLYIPVLSVALIGCGEKTYTIVEDLAGGGQMHTILAEDSATVVGQALYYSDGKVNFSGKFTNGERHGKWESFYPNGKKWSENNYDEGKYHGDYRVWFDNGQLRIQGKYDQGKEIGTWKFWDEKGNLLKEEKKD